MPKPKPRKRKRTKRKADALAAEHVAVDQRVAADQPPKKKKKGKKAEAASGSGPDAVPPTAPVVPIDHGEPPHGSVTARPLTPAEEKEAADKELERLGKQPCLIPLPGTRPTLLPGKSSVPPGGNVLSDGSDERAWVCPPQVRGLNATPAGNQGQAGLRFSNEEGKIKDTKH